MNTATRPNVEHYQYVVSWSPEDGEFVATVAEFPSLSWLASGQAEALRGMEQLLETVIDDLIESGEPVPEPLADASYSGRLNLRVDPSLHRRLALEAQRNRVSLNRWVISKLT
ncbi:type II toxin-antitoxin system HicB family antitoxin [Agromyces sp. ZXT2-3]|uniref:type II toxin-antitoxin system HicB family antitoxin n=1 Tax=Agromyces sp. ZXT2-3 TaxID=3461152 RepID=UPI004054E4E0